MTPRLRMLSVGLALSLSYAIYDYIDRNSDKKPVITKSKETAKKDAELWIKKIFITILINLILIILKK